MQGLSPPISLIHFSTVQIQIEEITRKLKTGDLGVSAVPEERFGITTLNIVPSNAKILIGLTEDNFLINSISRVFLLCNI